MNSMTVNELLKIVSDITQSKMFSSERLSEYYKEAIEFRGEENTHLEGIKLTGDEQVLGDNLLFYYIGHDGTCLVKDFESKEAMENVVFKYGKPKQSIFGVEEIGVFRKEDGSIETVIYVT